MEFKCSECGSRNAYDESPYAPGSSVEIPCRRCGTFNVVKITGDSVSREDCKTSHESPDNTDNRSNVSVLSNQQRPLTADVPATHNYEMGKRSATPIEKTGENADDIRKAEMLLEAERIKLEHRRLDLEQQRVNASAYSVESAPSKSKVTAGLLALFLGGFGTHKFYLGKTGMGILYLVFCWTYIPSVLALIEAISYFTKSDAQWAEEHP